MNVEQYCEGIEKKYWQQKQLMSTVPVQEDQSPLLSLKESGFDLILEPSIVTDYEYLVRESVFEKLGRISKQLMAYDKVLIIRSVWRSFKHQKLLWEKYLKIISNKYPNKKRREVKRIVSKFVASERESMHSTGGSVDALIYDLKEDRVMDFGTNDGFTIVINKKCYPLHPDIAPGAKSNRKLLMSLFEHEDFVCDLVEYWHFDYGNVVWALEKRKPYSIYGSVGRN